MLQLDRKDLIIKKKENLFYYPLAPILLPQSICTQNSAPVLSI